MNSHKSTKVKQKISKSEVARKALELKKAGLSYRAIGERLGKSHTQIKRYISEALDELNGETRELAERYRALQLIRYEGLLVPLQADIARGNHSAIEKARRILDSINSLMGTNAPTKIAATTPDGEEQAPHGVIVVPAVSGSVEEWLQEFGPKEQSE